MIRVGLIADTHGWLDEKVFSHFASCDEIWHMGDFGSMEIATKLQQFKPLRGVYGNIDDAHLRSEFPETLRFYCESVDVLMTHIGGYPGRYAPKVREIMKQNPPKLMLCGHSHIVKVIFDPKYQCLHINPGAAGKQGWHKKRTIMRLEIEGTEMRNCELIELASSRS
jgi:putative phosphoesterase